MVKFARDRDQNSATNSQEWQKMKIFFEAEGNLCGVCVSVQREYKEICARYREPTCKDKVRVPQHENLRQSTLLKSLPECSTVVESSWWWRPHIYRAPHFLMHSCCPHLFFYCCQSVQSHIDWLHALEWLKSRRTLSALRSKKTHTSSLSRNVVHLAEGDSTHGH